MGVVFTETWDTDVGGDDNFNAARVTSPTLEGVGALRLQSVGTQTYWGITSVGGPQNTMVARVWVRFEDFPEGDIRVIHADGTNNVLSIAWNSTTGQFGCTVDDAFVNGSGGPVVLIDKWYRIDARFDMRAVGGEIFSNGSIDGENLPHVVWGPLASTYDQYKLGPNNQARTMTMYYDSLQVSNTITDYPIGSSTNFHLGSRSAVMRSRGG